MYQKLTIEEKNNFKKEYKKTKKGSSLTKTLNRLVVEGMFLLVSCLIIICATLIYKLDWWYWFAAGLMLFCGTVFLIVQHKIRLKEYNNFLKVGKNKIKSKK